MEATGIPEMRTMLVSFRGRNVRSFRDDIEFSLEATAMSEDGVPRSVPWRQGGSHPLRLLPASGIFGANASGKSNFLRVLDDMRRLVLTSFSGDRTKRLGVHPFRLDNDYASAPSGYEIDLVLNGIRYEYGFTLDSTQVIDEYARYYPRGKAATLFNRDELHVQLGEKDRAKGRAVSEILRPNSLYLSAAAAADHPGLQPLYQWFHSNLKLCEASSRESRWTYTTRIMSKPENREFVLAMLHAADLGITGARVREPEPEMLDQIHRMFSAIQREIEPESEIEGSGSVKFDATSFLRIALSHRGKSGDVEFDTADESLGTLVWLGLIGPVLDALAAGTVLLVDELESSLHPALVKQLVRIFQRKHTNPNGAQLIFNSFEAGLLGNSVDDRILGRDQVWFTEKLYDGSTRLYSLTDLGPRKAEAVTRRYLDGRYGATPIINDAEFDALAVKVSSGLVE
ncbi:MAG: AAA family ATPase [Trebonia sp.]